MRTNGQRQQWNMEEVIGEADFNVKVEPDEVVIYGCHLCQDIIFEDYGDLQEHLEEHLDTDLKQEYDSDDEQSSYTWVFESNATLKSCSEEDEVEQKYQNTLLQCTNQSRKDLDLKVDSEIKPQGQESCNQEFSSKRKLSSSLSSYKLQENGKLKQKKKRKDAVAEEREFKCEICDKGFERKHSLIIHLRVHTGERPYTCEKCGASYKQSGDLAMHMRTHVGLKPFSCEVCGAKFLRRGDMNRHMLIHSDEKPYKCEECGRNYTRAYHLKLHWQNKHGGKDVWHGKDIRSGEKVRGKVQKQAKRYKCDLCSKTFKDKRNLKVHTQLHTGHRPFECNVCKKTFAHSGSFNIHKRIHTGEKPFACKLCDERFNCSSAVGKHHRRVHLKP